MTRYRSFYGSMTVQEAVNDLGKDHVEWLLGDWQRRLTAQIHGCWAANYMGHLMRSHTAYCALMQAGSVAAEEALKN